MTSLPIVTRLSRLFRPIQTPAATGTPPTPPPIPPRPDLHTLAEHPELLPPWVHESAVALRYLQELGPLAWAQIPKRASAPGGLHPPVPYAPFIAACLVKLDQHLASMNALREFLVEHPELAWVLGFPTVPSDHRPDRAEMEACLPTARHFTRLLRRLPNGVLQVLLDSSVALLRQASEASSPTFGQWVALDTKHIVARVKENNPKTYLTHRFDKTQQPAGDADCRLGCKRRHNQSAPGTKPTGEFYWGYASGIVTTTLPNGSDLVLAELTQPFDQPDVGYFFPLMAATEKRLGFRPKCGAFDAAFDAFYVYEYFDHDGGFAAVPFSERGGHKDRQFNPDGLPLCAAGLAMPLRYAFTDRSTLVEHERGRYVCPLLFPTASGQTCPLKHKKWKKGGCVTTLPTSRGARLRYQLDRHSPAYQAVYQQRTATERINSQAVALQIERPKLRNGQAIANLNTLIYVLINLRTFHRLSASPREPLPALGNA